VGFDNIIASNRASQQWKLYCNWNLIEETILAIKKRARRFKNFLFIQLETICVLCIKNFSPRKNISSRKKQRKRTTKTTKSLKPQKGNLIF
jgi:hypothetical protein